MEYNDKMLVRHPEIIPQSAMIIISSEQPVNNTASSSSSDKNDGSPWIVKGSQQTWVTGAHMAGRIHSWNRFHVAFQDKILGYVAHGFFFGEDQSVIQLTCLQHL